MPIYLTNILRSRVLAAGMGLGIAIGMMPAASASERIDPGSGGAIQSVTRTTVVRLSDLNLHDPAAAKALEKRLKIAAGQVCDKASLWTLRPPADYVRCFDAALSDARTQVTQRTASGDTTPISLSMR